MSKSERMKTATAMGGLRNKKLKKLALDKKTLEMFAKGKPDKPGGKRDYVAGDEKTFGEAFKFIRKNYGKDATFIWRGKKYKAKQKNEK
tara:strand:- start:426 stop:692 length:267 start_codon:yes stop_codon:yes gene_type:complete